MKRWLDSNETSLIEAEKERKSQRERKRKIERDRAREGNKRQ